MPLSLYFIVSFAIIFTALVNPSAARAETSNLDMILSKLDKTMERRSEFNNRKFRTLDSLKSGLRHAVRPDIKFAFAKKIATAYRNTQIDSACFYYDMAATLARDNGFTSAENTVRALRLSLMPIRGELNEALSEFKMIPSASIAPKDRADFYEAALYMEFNTLDIYYPDSLAVRYNSTGMELADSLIRYYPNGSPKQQYMVAHLYLSSDNHKMFVMTLGDILSRTPATDPAYAQAAYRLGIYYIDKGDRDMALYHLAQASISEIESSRLDGRALMILGRELYDYGDIKRSYHLLRLALDNAVVSGSRPRAIEAAKHIPIIVNAFREQDSRKVNLLILLSSLLVVLLVVIVGISLLLRREMQRLSHARRVLADANHMKDTYISRFLDLCAIYIDRIENFSLVARRKISAGQVDELFSMIKSGKMLNEQTSLFLETFDNAFTNIYPTFVSEVNKLLQPDKQISTPSPQRLTTELRILAMMRLGVEDASRMASVLGLSINTIYTYRNKLRSRAVDRSSFEASVMQIGEVR